MIKYLLTSIVFFTIQLVLFISFENRIQDYFAAEVGANSMMINQTQRKVLQLLKKINTNNRENVSSLYILGTSTGREFFLPDGELAKIMPGDVINHSVAYQDLMDSIRIIDNINVKDSIILFTITPNRFFSTIGPEQFEKSKYLMGQAIKYPVKSTFLDQYFKANKIDTDNELLEQVPGLNVYTSLLNDQVRAVFAYTATLNFKQIFNRRERGSQYKYFKKMPEKFLERKIESIRKKIGHNYKENIIKNFSLLEKVYEVSKKNKLKLVLFDLPHSNLYNRILKKEIAFYKKELLSFKKRYPKIFHYRFRGSLPVDDCTYFYDGYHVLPAGRKYFRDYMVRGLRYAAGNN